MSRKEIQQAVCKAMEHMPHKDAIKRIRLFGSHVHGDATPKSDVDLLVDFEANAGIGYFALVRMGDTLEEELGKKVDIVTPDSLSRYFRDTVIQEAELLYEKRS